MSKKNGVSVGEIQKFLSAHLMEIFITLHFLLLMIFVPLFPWGRSYISVLMACVGGLCGFWLSTPISRWLKAAVPFVLKQEAGTKYLFVGVGIAITCFAPPLAFFSLGVRSGLFAYEVSSNTSTIGQSEPFQKEDDTDY